MPLKFDIVCENTVGRPIAACAEHGFACLVQTGTRRWLFDTGSGRTLMENLAVLGHDAQLVEAVVLSHGHYDHGGGLMPFLKEVGARPVHAHPQVFKRRFWRGQHEEREISLPHSRAELEAAGARFHLHADLTELAPGLHFSGAIPRVAMLEKGDAHLVQPSADGAGWVADPFHDDGALALESSRGLVILLGCAHAGLVTTVEYFREKLRPARIHAIVGGTHLGPAGDEQFAATVDYLLRLDFDRLGLSHCTGQIRAAQLHARFPNKVFFANVGTTLTVE